MHNKFWSLSSGNCSFKQDLLAKTTTDFLLTMKLESRNVFMGGIFQTMTYSLYANNS